MQAADELPQVTEEENTDPTSFDDSVHSDMSLTSEDGCRNIKVYASDNS
jgi:hypothetical protein